MHYKYSSSAQPRRIISAALLLSLSLSLFSAAAAALVIIIMITFLRAWTAAEGGAVCNENILRHFAMAEFFYFAASGFN